MALQSGLSCSHEQQISNQSRQTREKTISFLRSCLAFSEVTIPSISGHVKQLYLYLETAEVSLMCSLIGHSDGLVDSALNCLQSLELGNDARPSVNDEVVTVIRKLCNLLLLVPGNPNHGATYIPKSLLALINSESWVTVSIKTRTLCGFVLSLAALSQRFNYYMSKYIADIYRLEKNVIDLYAILLQFSRDCKEWWTSFESLHPEFKRQIDELKKASAGYESYDLSTFGTSDGLETSSWDSISSYDSSLSAAYLGL